MIKQVIYSIAIISFIGVTPSCAQKILQFKEIDPNGREITIEDNYKIVDPNSTIDIYINNSALLGSIPTIEDRQFTERLMELKNMLDNEESAIQALKNAMDLYVTDSSDWSTVMSSLAPHVVAIFDNEETNDIYITEIPETDDFELQYRNLFKAASISVDRLEVHIKEYAEQNGVYIKLGAWLEGKNGNRPIHIPGYDDYETLPSSQVQQLVVVLNDEQQRQLSEISKLASDANKQGFLASLDAQNAVRRMLPMIMDLSSVKNVITLKLDVQSVIGNTTLQLAATKQTLEGIQSELKTYEQFLAAKLKKYETPLNENEPGELLLGINNDIEDIIGATKLLDTKLEQSVSTLQTQILGLNTSTVSAVDDIRQKAANLRGTVITEIEELKHKANVALTTIISGEQFKSNSYEFTKQVYKLTFDNIPKSANLDLETTGNRDIGDKIVFKLAVGRPSSSLTELEGRHFYLYFCTPFVRTTVGFLFIDPNPLFTRENDKALFQYAPSYSILLKGFWLNKTKSRKRLGYHRFWSPGIGLNIATVDFNSDGAMEIGLGGVFTICSDFLQIGYGINMFDGNGYSFLGLKIPVGSFGLR